VSIRSVWTERKTGRKTEMRRRSLPFVSDATTASRNPQTAADLAVVDASIHVTRWSTSHIDCYVPRWRHDDVGDAGQARLWQRRRRRRCAVDCRDAAGVSWRLYAALESVRLQCKPIIGVVLLRWEISQTDTGCESTDVVHAQRKRPRKHAKRLLIRRIF